MTDSERQNTRERIGKRISTLRKIQGLTQEELAMRTGLQRTHISRIENGKYAVTLETLQTIAKALNHKVDLVL